MLIKKVAVENFKSFEDQEICDFSQINMIYGYNNSGKSNFLKLLEIIFRRKISDTQTTQVLDGKQETHTEKTLGNWWEGTIENEPYIFRNGERDKPIKFTIKVGIEKSAIKEKISSFDDLKEAYFNDGDLAEIRQKVEDLQTKYDDSPSDDLQNQLNEARDLCEAIEEANEDDGNNVEFELSGQIVSRGNYDAEMILESGKIFDGIIYSSEGGDTYFEEVDDSSSLLEEPYTKFNGILSLLDDAVLFLDNDRYFITEKEDRRKNGISSKTFKNWLYNLYMDPYSFQEYNNILREIRKFDPSSGGDGTIKSMEKNSPLKSFGIDFGRTETNELLLLLSNDIDSVDRLPLESYGTGIQQILYILARIAEFNPKILLLEELELNLSPKYQEDLVQHILLELIHKTDRDLAQLFFTSHSPILCIHTDYQIHQVTIDENGASSLSKADKDKISEFYPKEVIQRIIEQHK